MTPVGFELTISAGKRPQTHALDRAATATGTFTYLFLTNNLNFRTYVGMLWASDNLVK
jgi:hypothetical protein